MASLSEVSASLAEVQAAIDAEHQEVAGKISVLIAQSNDQLVQIKALQDQIAAGGAATAADLDAVVAKAQEIKAGIMNISEPV